MSIESFMSSSWLDQSLMYLLKTPGGCVTLGVRPCQVDCDLRALLKSLHDETVERQRYIVPVAVDPARSSSTIFVS